ncbi:PLP-dependent aminotransferase family protein [Paenibacillus sp. N1-5-1-14]|uniref:aminotransferase-like domain-containing protein n=1 Tax=Paenibacillus radicibacter TaxID=2972488 RepID=UPI002158E970|nr:PLP-dependent aminotransferase family protein [Paenibacillus radicibacter]MCR8645216.1 PLP-dependent aminotransferase family protein [Paenibacillus radicibacter]
MDFHLPYLLYMEKYTSKTTALYYALRDRIVAGELASGAKLPSSRDLANSYGLARGTVNTVYETLIAEGYLRGELGRGTFVAYSDDRKVDRNNDMKDVQAGQSDVRTTIRLSAWGERVAELWVQPNREEDDVEQNRRSSTGSVNNRGNKRKVHWGDRFQANGSNLADVGGSSEVDGKERLNVRWAFQQALPDLRYFPVVEWNRCVHEEVRMMSQQHERDLHLTEGSLELREAIAQHVQRSRGIDAKAEQIVIVNGSMQAIALLAQLLVSPGDRVVIESPGYSPVARAAQAAGGEVLLASVDASGIVPQPWDARLLHVTPSRQFPTGSVLPLERRQALLRWAAEHDAVIVEDDYDSEFRHRGRPLEPLKRLDADGRVVYIGTFTLTMLRTLRIAYAVLPEGLTAAFVAAKRMYEPVSTGLVMQRALAAFMRSGAYERHLRRMKRVYARKYEFFIGLLQNKLTHLFDWVECDSGLHVFGWWKHNSESYATYKQACRKSGLDWIEVSARHLLPEGKVGASFSFSHFTLEELEEAVEMMYDISCSTSKLHPL